MILGTFKELVQADVTADPVTNCRLFYEAVPRLIAEGTIPDNTGMQEFGFRTWYIDTQNNLCVNEKKSAGCYAEWEVSSYMKHYETCKHYLMHQCAYYDKRTLQYFKNIDFSNTAFRDVNELVEYCTVKVMQLFDAWHLNPPDDIEYAKKYGLFLRTDKPNKSSMVAATSWRLHMEMQHKLLAVGSLMKIGASTSDALLLGDMLRRCSEDSNNFYFKSQSDAGHWVSHMDIGKWSFAKDAMKRLREDDSYLMCEKNAYQQGIAALFTGYGGVARPIESTPKDTREEILNQFIKYLEVTTDIKVGTYDYGSRIVELKDLQVAVGKLHEFLTKVYKEENKDE